MSAATVAAVDLGATSGRVMLARVSATSLDLEQVARFANDPVDLPDGLHWNALGLYSAVLEGLRVAGREASTRGSSDTGQHGAALDSIGVDSWAVDYALERGGRVLGIPYHYRDARTAAGVAAVHERVAPDELYRITGLQHLPFTTLYQLATEQLDERDRMLLIPDLIAFWLTGERGAEVTNASTTGLLDVASGTWSDGLVTRLGFPRAILPPLVQPGSVIGALRPAVAAATGVTAPVTAVGSHDTASAVVAVPAVGDDHAYISCGTWGLVGVELERPVLTEASRAANFTNEGGVDGRIRYLHNVMGLWLLTESVREWERDGTRVDLVELLDAAAAVTTPVAVFDANDPGFLPPGSMATRIAEHCREHALPVPATRAELARSVVESLAAAFADAVRAASTLSGRRVSVVHLVGGGSRNRLLCQLTADRLGLPVVAGPVEATAIGNVLVQARALGAVTGDLETLRALVASTVHTERFEPRRR